MSLFNDNPTVPFPFGGVVHKVNNSFLNPIPVYNPLDILLFLGFTVYV